MRVLKKELWPHKVEINVVDLQKISNIEQWLESRYGEFNDQWNVLYQYNRTDYYFRQGQDATMFALRWS